MQTSIQQQIAGLHEMTVRELRQRYAEVYGESTRAHSKPHMIRKIAWRIQALAEGELSERARQRAAELANDADVRIVPPKAKEDKAKLFMPTASDPRLPAPGGAIVRKYKGRVIRVIVMELTTTHRRSVHRGNATRPVAIAAQFSGPGKKPSRCRRNCARLIANFPSPSVSAYNHWPQRGERNTAGHRTGFTMPRPRRFAPSLGWKRRKRCWGMPGPM